jgi:hypothetical protein
MPDGPWHVYVYYSVAPQLGDGAAAAAALLLAQVKAATGLAGRIRHRADDPWLWMEIYEGVTDRAGFTDTLARLRAATALPACLAPGKTFHTECFQDFDA